MIAERLVSLGNKLISGYPPEGREYWAARFWDRDKAELDPVLGDHYRAQKAVLGDLIDKYGARADRVIEFACGTGEFTKIVADRVGPSELIAVDISAEGLARTKARVADDRLQVVQGDFWQDHGLEPAPLVVCVDAIHHLGDVRTVLERLRTFVAPGGYLIGNVWTRDHFHEFQRQRYGALRHAARSALFLASAVTLRATKGRIRWASYRTQLLPSEKVLRLLGDTFPTVLETAPDRFFFGFVCPA
ncbi:class I SAM-dependent methyltransferase [Streptomyces canus]|uniref:class I SAM-dependent DNA methyltransferase n=1 Tax=Streptomyces canus TaxID=58343 RepID=UPI0033B098DB